MMSAMMCKKFRISFTRCLGNVKNIANSLLIVGVCSATRGLHKCYLCRFNFKSKVVKFDHFTKFSNVYQIRKNYHLIKLY